MYKKILFYDSVSSRIREIIQLRYSLTDRMSSSLLLHRKILLQLIVMITYLQRLSQSRSQSQGSRIAGGIQAQKTERTKRTDTELPLAESFKYKAL
jgi:hypothetical protein